MAQPCLEIAKNPKDVYQYTNKGNLVAVVSTGSAVLGLGNIGPLASKPVMEGKAVLFKHFAGIDVYDIELDCASSDAVVETVAAMAPTFGGINLEDIKAPECFYIEEKLKQRLDIPVFHDDQHGTAIVVTAGLLNALTLQNKQLDQCKIVCLGAGAAGIATVKLLKAFGACDIEVVDGKGHYSDREGLNPYKQAIAIETSNRALDDALKDADVFIGVSGPGLVSDDQVGLMRDDAIIFALSNPDPEIEPDVARAKLPNAIIATGRSDHPNQINNVLCFLLFFMAHYEHRPKALIWP